jgi:hypothetical protein
MAPVWFQHWAGLWRFLVQGAISEQPFFCIQGTKAEVQCPGRLGNARERGEQKAKTHRVEESAGWISD